jgi:hypothetical protein
MTIIITAPGKKAVRIQKSHYRQEAVLQQYLSENPEVLPVQELKEDAHLVVLERESPTGAGPVDILAVDQDGELYLIETKLYRNPDKRQVLAQLLDYGAALWKTVDDPDAWLAQIDRRRSSKSKELLIDLLESEFGEGQSQAVLDGAKSCLVNGSFHFFVLMDEVHTQLKNLIQFINRNSRFSIYVVEMEHYQHHDLGIFIPHLYGEEVTKKPVIYQGGLRRQWDESSFFEQAAQKLSPEGFKAVRKLHDKLKEIPACEISFGNGKDIASFNPKFDTIAVRSIISVYSTGQVALNYYWLSENEHARVCGRLLKEKLKTIPPFKEAVEKSGKKYPSVRLSAWLPYCDEFIRLIQDYVKECEQIAGS